MQVLTEFIDEHRGTAGRANLQDCLLPVLTPLQQRANAGTEYQSDRPLCKGHCRTEGPVVRAHELLVDLGRRHLEARATEKYERCA
jgi:hypothetical protein